MWKIGLKFFARFLSNLVRLLTSIEIHPAATIGHSFFIDHGAGLVIGETSIIGNNVTMYQQTTLGGLTPSIDSNLQRNVKRHPTLDDNVIVGSGAQVLGPVHIGKNSELAQMQWYLMMCLQTQLLLVSQLEKFNQILKRVQNYLRHMEFQKEKLTIPIKKVLMLCLKRFIFLMKESLNCKKF